MLKHLKKCAPVKMCLHIEKKLQKKCFFLFAISVCPCVKIFTSVKHFLTSEMCFNSSYQHTDAHKCNHLVHTHMHNLKL